MFALQDKSGELVKSVLTGEPFLYSSKKLALLGKKALEADRKDSFKIVGGK